MMDSTCLRFRDASPEDAATLSEIALRAKAVWGYPRSWLDEWRDQLTIEANDIERDELRIALSDQKIVGFVAVGNGEILHLWIDPNAQGHGIGRALFEEALTVARRLQLRRLRVESDPNALGFYLKMGCRVIGTVQANVSGHMRSLPVLEIELSRPVL